MPNSGINGVNLSTGKLTLPIALGSVSGPNGFGETVAINYSTNGLLEQIKTWNTQAATSILGLGWSLQTSYITRIGNGSWQDSFYLVFEGNTYPLLLVSSPTLPWSTSSLTFVTQVSSMLKITYTPASNGPLDDTWTVTDSNGVRFRFGGQQTKPHNSQPVDLSVKWLASATATQPNNQPAIWSGSSIQTDGQNQYATVWRLSAKTSPSGQKILYVYQPVSQNVGSTGQGLTYTMASYLTNIYVRGGGSVTFNYDVKNNWEYPAFRSFKSNNQITNAYQDRIETQFLQSIDFYDEHTVLQTQVKLEYDFLYNHFPEKSFVVDRTKTEILQDMNKRLLVSIQTELPENIPFAPSQKFDYWGLWDEQLQAQICESNKDLRALSTQSLAIRGIKQYKGADKYPNRSYNALFGHLKTIQSPGGSLTWYSYSDNSITEKKGLNGENDWDLTLDKLGDISPDDNIATKYNINWQTKGQPYWGPDGYVIIRWDGTSGTGTTKKKYIYLTIYEWLGKWIPMHIPDDEMLFLVHKFDDIAIRLSVGVGKFALVRTHVASQDVQGTVTLFHRDAFIPGKWNSTYFTPQTCKTGGSLPSKPNDDPSGIFNTINYDFCQLNIGMGDNIIALLDVISGRLHLYNLAYNQWSSYQGSAGIIITKQIWMFAGDNMLSPFYFPDVLSTIIVMGNDVFVMKNITTHDLGNIQKCTISYLLYHYDETGSGWNNTVEETVWKDSVLKNMLSQSYVQELVGTLAQGYGVVEIVANYNPGMPGTTLIGRPIVVSWDSNYQQVNIQPIYSPNNAGDYTHNDPLYWGDVFQKTPWPWQGNLSGTTNVSNLFNISTGTGDPRKYIARYVGGKNINDQGYNYGWSCDGTLSNLPDNSDPWEQMATIDTTVAIRKGGSETYTYKFYQFNPYATGSPWVLQNVLMGKNKDWADIERIINETLFFINLGIMIPATIASGGAFFVDLGYFGAYASEILAADFTLNNATNLANYYTTVAGGISSKILSTSITNARRGDTSLGLDYLLVGTNKTGAPRAYSKRWDTILNQWVWGDADIFVLLQNIKVDIPSPLENMPTGNKLACDVYRYGSSFIPFSYMGYKDHGRQDINGRWYYRQIYSDQVAFFQNGILSKLVPLPNFTSTGHYHYENITAKYSIFQGGRENWTLYAPWGGILVYQPQVYSDYYKPNHQVLDDVIWEGASGQTWQENAPSTSEPSTDAFESPTVKKSLGLGLIMARDNAITGPLSDFVVDKVSLDDGYQVYDTHMRYIGYRALYKKSIGSVMYNQVRVASGETDYITAAENNGWIEYYYYNGLNEYIKGINHNTLLPFDPATDTLNPLYEQGKNLTNATVNVNGLIGQCYCQRIMKNNPENAYSGIEMSRQYYYYMGYSQTVRNPSNLNEVSTFFSYDSNLKSINNPLQQTSGVAQTSSVTLTAPDSTSQEFIQNNSSYTVTTSNIYYDLSGLQGSNELTGYETGLPLSSQTTSNHMVQGETNPITQLTVSQNTYAFQNPTYQPYFTSANIWNPVIQAITSQTNDSSPQTLSFVSASATIWTDDKSNPRDSYWYPYANYRWVGSSTGSISSGVPWSATDETQLLPLQADWQINSFVRKIKSGIVYDAVNVQQFINSNGTILLQGPRQTILYDVNSVRPIATFAFPNVNNTGIGEITDEMVRFCSFERYEYLSGWATLSGDTFNPISSSDFTSYLTTGTCYVGQRSLKLPTTPIYWGSTQQDQDSGYPPSQLVLSFFYMVTGSTTNGVTITVQVPNAPILLTQTFNPPLVNEWYYQQVFIDLTSFNDLPSQYPLWIGFNFNNVAGGTAYGVVDAISLMPLSAQGKFVVYDPSTHLIRATIDSNGLTLRNAYNNRQQLIGISQGRGLGQHVINVPIQYYSRDGNKGDFSPDGSDPNCSTLIQATNGGPYFDFRSRGDFMGWTSYLSGSTPNGGTRGLSIQSNALCVQAGYVATHKRGGCINGAGLRVQIQGNTIPINTGISLNNLIVTWSDNNQFTITLPSGTQETVSVSNSPVDWLLLCYINSAYFFADGQLIFSRPLESSINLTSALVNLIASNNADPSVSFKDIMLIKDPSLSSQFIDAAGKVRQVQTLTDLTTSNQIDAGQNNTDLNVRRKR